MAMDCVTLDCCRTVDYDRPGRPQEAEGAGHEVRKKTQAAPGASEPAVIESQQETEETVPEAEGARGVIRLLQQGHFQGVADVRLRINFHDELVGMERQQLQALAEENIAGLQQTVADGLNAMVAAGLPEQQAAELASTFEQTVAGLLQGSPDTGLLSRDTLVAGLESAFGNLLTALPAAESADPTESETTSSATDKPVEQLDAADPGTDADSANEPPAPQTLLEQLTSAFSTALEVFTDALDDVTLMPALSAPKGNGTAYQKFLAIYNDLGGTNPQTPPAPEDIIDTLA